MSIIQLNYGDTHQGCNIPDHSIIEYCQPPDNQSIQVSEETLIQRSFSQIIPPVSLNKLTANARVGIAINDHTRPAPSNVVIRYLLNWLSDKGIPSENIRFYVASGTHRPVSNDVLQKYLPDPLKDNRFSICIHDCLDTANLEYLGETTPNHTPVWINRDFYHRDFRIAIGTLEPHHFMGFSGGYKTVSIGLTGMETIQKNHSLLPDDNCIIGNITNNPMRLDVEEIGKKTGLDMVINAVIGPDKKTHMILTGHPHQVLLQGYKTSLNLCQTKIEHTYPLVVASCGGYPKDINFYQAQKGMTNAAQMTEQNGIIILLAECRDGHGSQGFYDFMLGTKSPDDVLLKWSKSAFQIGPHKAFLTCRILKQKRVILVSDIESRIVKELHMTPAKNLQEAIDIAFSWKKSVPTTGILPFACTTLPIIIQ